MKNIKTTVQALVLTALVLLFIVGATQALLMLFK